MITAAIIPARNEAKRIKAVIEHTLPYVDFVIVVDDGSTDDTFQVIGSIPNAKVIPVHHQVNLGKGAALKTGCDAAVRLKADAMICLDADGQHDPKSIPLFIEQLQKGNVDVVFGMRTFNSKMPMMMLMGNHLLSKCISQLFHVMIHDTQSGYRAFSAVAYQKLRWHSTGYEAETEMIVRAGQYQLRYTEVDIDTIYHDSYKGTTVVDGMKIFLHILRWKFI